MTQHVFQAEVSEVLRLVIHSLYSNREIFLRELVSNASDALDKLRFRAVTEPALMGDDQTLEIRIFPNAEANTLTIEDTGCGMTEEELIKNLGTVAHSGTKTLLQKLGDAKGDLKLIGQFGVGFYSAYLVADRVEVFTRAAGADAKGFKWESDASSSFTVEPSDKAERGTKIVLHIKEEHKEFLEGWKLKSLIEKYSDYVNYPIKIERKPKEGEAVLEQANRANALWQRPKAEITAEQYEEFYKHVAHDHEGPLAQTHFKVEGSLELAGILFVPKRAPYDLFEQNGKRRGIRLFVKRVFIMDDCEEVLPVWLRFMRGVVDSDDLPLNVSRELLQDSAIVRAITKQVTKKSLDLIEEIATEKKDDYLVFYKAFGQVLKEGLATDWEYKERLAKLVRYESTREEGLVSLDEYKARAKEGQKEIYYLYGTNRTAVKESPYLEALRAKGYEVLLMTDAVDEWACEALGEYDGMKLVSAMKADLKLDEPDEKAKEETNTKFKPFFDRAKKVLGDRVKDVRVTDKLTDSAACLSLDHGGMPAYMEQLMRAQGRGVANSKRIFEVNPTHPIVEKLLARADEESKLVDDVIELLYDQARLVEGSNVDDPQKFGARLTSLLQGALT